MELPMSENDKQPAALIIGAGIAGIRAAIEAAEHCNVTRVCKVSFCDSNTWNAQGGIASVLDSNDSIQSHISDTLATGCGSCDEQVVKLVISQGPELVGQLVDWGTEFDTVDGHIDITREGGHSHARQSHAGRRP